MPSVSRPPSVRAVGFLHILEESVSEMGETLSVERLVVDGEVDDLKRDEAHYLGSLWRSNEDAEASLPAGGVDADLIDELKCLFSR